MILKEVYFVKEGGYFGVFIDVLVLMEFGILMVMIKWNCLDFVFSGCVDGYFRRICFWKLFLVIMILK